MEYIYHIDDRCDAKVTTRSNVLNVEKVYEALDNVHKEMFLKSCFGKLYDIRNMKISAQLIHNLLLRRVVSVNEEELWFCLGSEKVVRFSLYEFMLITGLSTANEAEYKNQINEDGRLKNKYFPASSKVTPKELEMAFEKEIEDMDDKYKLGLVLIYETVLRSKEKNTSIDLLTLDIVDDLELFNKYSWGIKSFKFTIHAFLRLSKDPKPKYSLWGFPLAIQVWAFESIPRIANMYHARLSVNGLPRMCRWKSTVTPNSHDIAEVLDDPQLQVRCSLTASPDETEQQYVKFFVHENRKEDPILDVYLYEDGGYPDVDGAALDDNLDLPQSQREGVSPNIREDDMQSPGTARVHQRYVPTNQRPPRSRPASCDHGDMLRQLLHHVERLSEKYEEINRKVDTIMNWMRPSQHLDRDHSFGNDGVFETEEDNPEEVEREMEEGDSMGETGARDVVGEFAAGGAVMEIAVGGVESEAETCEIGREEVTRNIEKGVATVEEDETRTIESETIAGCNEREIGVGNVVIETVTGNEMTSMYTKVFTRKKRNLDKANQQTDTLMRDKRLKKASKLVSSPYTTGAKWRRHVDDTRVDLFRDVDPVKKKQFSTWHSNLGDGVSYKLGHLNLQDAKKWFNDVLKPGGWFLDDHVDMALHLLRARATKYPKSFGGSRAILDVQFNNELIFAMLNLRKQGDHFRMSDELMEYITGAKPSFGRKWQECTHVYFPLCTRRHWLAVEIDFCKETMYVYDPDKGCITSDQLKEELKAASIIVPLLLKEININLETNTLAIERNTKVAKQVVSGDCGMYVVKYIEFLSINSPVEQVNGFYMSRWREKMAADIFALDYEP